MTNLHRLREQLTEHGQAHLWDHWQQLDGAQQASFERQLASLDLPLLRKLVLGHELSEDWDAVASQANSPPAMRWEGPNRFSPEQAREAGENALRAGQVAALLVAGGQGTRLGFPHPKGMYPLGPVSQRTLFQILCDQLSAAHRHYAATIPLFLMTSPATHDETVAYFQSNNHLGLPASDVHLFCQGTMPAVDAVTGQVLLEGPGRISLSPDGHGGTVQALARHGCLAQMEQTGIEYVFYFQVDNPLVRVCDPEFIGYHILSQAEMSTQVIAKRDPMERVGNVVQVDGVLRIIEYSDLPRAAAERRHADGSLVMWAGNTAVHVFSRPFLQHAESHAVLPFHRALKKVPCLDSRGGLNQPSQPNAVKFERFIFDLMPAARNAIVMEVRAEDCFAPVKNPPGDAHDSPDTARRALLRQHRQWLREVGVPVADDVLVEIHPCFARNVEELRRRLPQLASLRGDTYFPDPNPAGVARAALGLN